MKKEQFTNEKILSWMQYYADRTPIDLEQIKMMDVTKKNKNLIPTVESHKAVLAFMEAGDQNIFYNMWNAGLGDCQVWYNEGSVPEGDVKHDKVSDMINRGINASAAMLVVNENSRNTIKIGLDNPYFRINASGIGSEVRTVILNKMDIDREDTVCVVGSSALSIEAAFQASEGKVIAVEYNGHDRDALEESVAYYDLRNVEVFDHVDEEMLKAEASPDVAFLTASASTEQEVKFLLRENPGMNIVIYTLDFVAAAAMRGTLEKAGIKEAEVLQISVARLAANNAFQAQPAPWIITGRREC
ncbi:precorrin-6B methylase [Aminicella lysinilytica]|uniref:Precorrin-6Y C5,15-methyltransferase (Decarboxylating) n=1 Tax=Aminicella lysinilytica TaxID=433323 RepID=A0A4R6PZJ4_9FIRM|nr:precorrin-6B methylase [Aminicella lysinilytica]TDP51028.1 precorrin-6Y C5,15-methyltransferase (decarboxylating) [Aminicella lysinilytica]